MTDRTVLEGRPAGSMRVDCRRGCRCPALEPRDARPSPVRRRDRIAVSLALPLLILCWDLAGRLDESANRRAAGRPEVATTSARPLIVGAAR